MFLRTALVIAEISNIAHGGMKNPNSPHWVSKNVETSQRRVQDLMPSVGVDLLAWVNKIMRKSAFQDDAA